MRERLKRWSEKVPLRSQATSGVTHGLLSVLAAFLAYLPTQAVGLQDGFWSAITAITVAQTKYKATATTASDQFTASRLAAVTTTIILLVPHTGSPQQMMIARLSEVGWGIAVAAGLVWIATHLGLVKRPNDEAHP